jgi:hypothetical protein
MTAMFNLLLGDCDRRRAGAASAAPAPTAEYCRKRLRGMGLDKSVELFDVDMIYSYAQPFFQTRSFFDCDVGSRILTMPD